MTQIDQLKIMNDTMILYLTKLGKDTQRNEIIKNMLEDEACFFKLEKEDASIVLQDIGVGKEEIENTYSKLVSSDVFYDLLNNNKINENDEELKIKYKNYDSKEIFQSKITEENTVQTEKNNQIDEVKKLSFWSKVFNKIKRIFSKK